MSLVDHNKKKHLKRIAVFKTFFDQCILKAMNYPSRPSALAEKLKEKLELVGENTEKYITFSVSTKK